MRTIKLQKNLQRVFLLALLTGLILCPLITVFAKAVIIDGRLDLYQAWRIIASTENVQTVCNSLLLGVCVVLFTAIPPLHPSTSGARRAYPPSAWKQSGTDSG